MKIEKIKQEEKISTIEKMKKYEILAAGLVKVSGGLFNQTASCENDPSKK